MPRYIIKLHDERDNKDYYMEWSTIVEAPVTYGMSLEHFNEYYRDSYGESGMKEFKERMLRVEEHGVSGYPYYKNAEDIMTEYDMNRPKVGDVKEFILENFCRNWNKNL